MLPAVFDLLSNDAAVSALLGAGSASRVYPWGEAKPDVLRPYVTWFVVGGSPDNTMSDTPPVDSFVVQIDTWGDTGSSVKAVATAVRNAIETMATVIAYNPSDRDPETGRYRLSFDAEFHVLR